jgi:hypothetical protein
MNSMPKLLTLPTLLLALAVCTNPDPNPPTVSISSPSVGQPVSGTVQLHCS